MNPLMYSTILLIPGFAILGLLAGGLWTFSVLILCFVLLPLAEIFWRGDQIETDLAITEDPKYRAHINFPIYSAVACHFGLLVFFLSSISNQSYAVWEIVGLITAMAISCGAIGINIAHELGHRVDRRDQRIAKLLLCTSLYVHFFIEHNRGHHAQVGTTSDPATARKGITVYRFLPKSVIGGWLSAWKLESDRLRRRKQRTLSFGNEMIRWQAIQLCMVGAIGVTFGTTSLLAFIGAAGGGVFLLECINYVEHYGLVRGRTSEGRLLPVKPEHSWNSSSLLGRLFLFELPRHSDHHARPKKTYSTLRHMDEAPLLPTGYSGMILLSLIPPVYFAIMHPLLAERT